MNPTTDRKLRGWLAAALIATSVGWLAAEGGGASAFADDETATEAAAPAPADTPRADGPSTPDLRELNQWLEQKATLQLVSMPSEARLSYRRGQLAWKSGEVAKAVSLMRGAAELDPHFAAPHLALGWWFLTREPSQALMSWSSLLHRFKDDFSLQLEMAGNAIFFGVHAVFFGFLGAALILLGLHQHELRHLWRERLGVVLAPRSAVIWSWAFLLMPWLLGLGLTLPTLMMLAMLWPVIRIRERLIFLTLAVMVGVAPLSGMVLGRLALPLRADGAPFYGVAALNNRDYSAEEHERVARLAAEHPESPYLHFGLGWLARRAGDQAGAEAAYRRTLELWPANSEALNNLGNLLAMQGRFDEALESFRRAAEASPGNAAAHFNASQVHTRLFDYRAASDAVARASALDFEMVRSYQTRSGESGDLPLIDQWIDARRSWTTLLQARQTDVTPLLPAAWRRLIETSGWHAMTAMGLTLIGLGLGLWWQQKMPMRSCSNCARPVCRRCAQRLREVALCPECSVIAARAESGEFGRVLLHQQRRRIERSRTLVRTAGAALVPGLGLLARRRTVTAIVLLTATAGIVSRFIDLRAPFALSGQMSGGAAGVEWGMVATCVLVYAVSLLGYLTTAEPDMPQVRVAPTGSRSSALQEPPAQAA